MGEGATPRFFLRPIGDREWQPDGAVSREGKIWGTYLHGLFASGPFLQGWLSGVGAEREVHIQVGWQEWQDEQDFQLDRLANALEEHLDMITIRTLAGVGDK